MRNQFQNKITSNVVLCGNVSNVNEYLNVADFFVSVSKAEGMPNAVLEAMSVGLPVILSDIEPHKEIFNENKGIGLLFKTDIEQDFLDKLHKLTTMDYEKMSNAAKNVVEEKFSAQIMSKEYQKIYKSVVKLS